MRNIKCLFIDPIYSQYVLIIGCGNILLLQFSLHIIISYTNEPFSLHILANLVSPQFPIS
jgi:hypothetical protein